MRLPAVVLLVALFVAATVAADAPFHFVDATAASGVTAPTWCGGPDKPHILESGGTGLALFDYDGDGDLDLYLVNGWRRWRRTANREAASRPARPRRGITVL